MIFDCEDFIVLIWRLCTSLHLFVLSFASLIPRNNDATSGQDYDIPIKTFEFTSFTGSQTRSIVVNILHDSFVEYDETFKVVLSLPMLLRPLAQLGNPSETVIKILNDDSKLNLR